MIFGAILAGGIGSRMNLKDMPKQFLPMGAAPVIIHTLKKVLSCSEINEIYIGVHREWISHMHELISAYLPDDSQRLYVVEGGADRNGTIFNIISAIEQRHGSSDEHIVLTHDSVRPFVSLEIIEENISAAKKHGAVNTVVPAVDTIVISKDGAFVSDIPERKYIYHGQTPQTFKINMLKELFASLSADEKEILTDACKICVMRGVPVCMVQGSYMNMKITTPADYQIALAISSNETESI